MKLKIADIIGVFILIIVIGYILLPWVKENVKLEEKFSVEIATEINNNDSVISLFDYILESRNFSKEFEGQINDLKNLLKTDGVLNSDNYMNIINEVKKILDDENNSKKEFGNYLLTNNSQSQIIKDLENQINNLNTEINYKINDTILSQPVSSDNTKHKTIKSLKYGISLNIMELTNGKIMITLNNGCLTYNKNNNKDNYSVTNCEITNTMQHFIVRDNIKNIVISPIDNLDLYLKVDNIGLSLEKYIPPYNSFSTPRSTPTPPRSTTTPPRSTPTPPRSTTTPPRSTPTPPRSTTTPPRSTTTPPRSTTTPPRSTPTPPRSTPTPPRSTPTPPNNIKLNCPDDLIWVILPFEINGCRKMEKNEITIKQ
jgi:hypothetical protein